VVIVSHDRHMIETTADRLVLVDAGTARDYDGSLDDYIAFVLAKDASDSRGAEAKVDRKEARRAAAEAREKAQELRKAAAKAEAELARLTGERSAIDRAMFDPSSAEADLAKLAMGELMRRRAQLETRIAAIEAEWLEASEKLEQVAA
jgi:ATP-binding cassette subfamily F protein 3